MNTTTKTTIEIEEFIEKSCGENNCRSDGMMGNKMFEQFNFYIGLKELHEKMIEEREKGR